MRRRLAQLAAVRETGRGGSRWWAPETLSDTGGGYTDSSTISAPIPTETYLGIVGAKTPNLPLENWHVRSTVYVRNLNGTMDPTEEPATAPVAGVRAALNAAAAILLGLTTEAALEVRVARYRQHTFVFDGSRPGVVDGPDLGNHIGQRRARVYYRDVEAADCRQWNRAQLLQLLPQEWHYSWYECL